MSRQYKTYLGDGVYVGFDGFAAVLTTENGFSVTNEIMLEPAVFAALEVWWRRVKQEPREQARQEESDGER